jgi:sulfatase modifying factor 1
MCSYPICVRFLFCFTCVVVACSVSKSDDLPASVEGELFGKLVLMKPGKFFLGAVDGDAKAQVWELPRHEVAVKNEFYIGACEITYAQFQKFSVDSGYLAEAETDGLGGWGVNLEERRFEREATKYTWRNVGFEQSPYSPVVNVTWHDAVAFCRWLNEKQNRFIFRLPNEIE